MVEGGRESFEWRTVCCRDTYDCLPSLLGDADKFNWNNVWQGKKYFVLGQLEKPRQDNKLLYRLYDEPSEPTKEGTLSFVLLVFPFVSVSRVSRGHPSLFSLVCWLGKLIRKSCNHFNKYTWLYKVCIFSGSQAFNFNTSKLLYTISVFINGSGIRFLKSYIVKMPCIATVPATTSSG